MHTYAYLHTSTTADNLKKGRPMLACKLNICVHMLKALGLFGNYLKGLCKLNI
jgi:hypothetical protein